LKCHSSEPVGPAHGRITTPDPTNENLTAWILRILADYDGRFTLDGDTFTKDAIWIRGPRGSFMVSREEWDDDRSGLEKKLRQWAELAF